MNQDDQKLVCPDCGEKIEIADEMAVGDILECSECGTEVEIQSIAPLVFRELVEEK